MYFKDNHKKILSQIVLLLLLYFKSYGGFIKNSLLPIGKQGRCDFSVGNLDVDVIFILGNLMRMGCFTTIYFCY